MLDTAAEHVESLSDLHTARSVDELRDLLAQRVEALHPSTTAVLIDEDDASATCVWSAKQGAPITVTASERDALCAEAAWSLPLIYDGQKVGILLADAAPHPDMLAHLRTLMTHWTTALVNKRLSENSNKLIDEYAASSLALQEGIHLFRETDRATIGARFLDLWCKSLGAEAAAVYVLDEIGNRASTLALEHALGVPESVLDELRDESGAWLPTLLLERGWTCIERQEDGRFGMLDASRLQSAMHNVMGTPLEYHGITCGIAIAFNIAERSLKSRTRMVGARRLSELGAALFHRLHLQEGIVRARLFDNQLEIASALQRRLIPMKAPSSNCNTFAWSSTPALYVGGDYVDIYADEDEIVFAIADVSGHGVNSAILMSSYRAGCRAQCRATSASSVLTAMNDIVHGEVGDTGMFLTAVLGRVPQNGSTLSVASAGHNPVLIYRAASSTFEQIDSSGPPLGFIPGIGYEEERVDLRPGDLLVLYTDGVVEATPPDSDDMFGMDRLEAVIREHGSSGAEAVRRAILTRVEAHAREGMREDDVSILILEHS